MPFKLTSLSPSGSSTRATLIEFDDVRILADPGWDGVSDIAYLKEVINTVDIILLSHPTTDFIGAYAWLAFGNLQKPVYATLPTCNLGRVATIDLYRSLALIGPVKGTQFELTDVEEAFDKVITVKHSQLTDLRAKYDGLSLTAVNSGHTLGGTIWVLNKNSEKVIYAPEWNHSKDSFLNGAEMLQNPTLMRPSILVTSSTIGSPLSHKRRVEKFFELVDATLGRGGTVFLPTTIGGRLLELIHLIDEHLQSAPIPVLLVAHAKARSLTYAGSMLEWMAPAVIKEWEARGQAPFDASRVQVIEPKELLNMPGAKVVFASGVGFENGTQAQSALLNLCNDEKTTIIMTERAVKGTVGNDLFHTWEALTKEKTSVIEEGTPVPLTKQLQLVNIREEKLLGDELTTYETEVKARRAAKEEKKKARALEKTQIRFEDEDESESEDEDDLLEQSSKKEELIPVDVDMKTAKGRSRMFPYVPFKAKVDDYGVVINHADYAREEEKDVSKLKKKENQKMKLGEKKKWNEGKKQDDVSNLDALFEPVARYITSLLVPSRCVLSYVDLAGIVDLRSMSLIIPALKPQSVLLISDLSDDSNLEKITTMLKKHNKFEVVEVAANQTQVTDNTIQSFDIVLDDSLSSKLKWQKIAGGFTIAHVIGEVKTKGELEDEKKEDLDMKNEDQDEEIEDSKKAEELVLVPLKQPALLSNIRAAPLAIGDVRLSELKKTLSEWHKVEFKGEGTLVIDDIVAVRKVSDGDVIVDGLPGELFYKVRDAVRKMLAYV
jgi:cleavage and polyadenylation specificity factor subunit 2